MIQCKHFSVDNETSCVLFIKKLLSIDFKIEIYVFIAIVFLTLLTHLSKYILPLCNDLYVIKIMKVLYICQKILWEAWSEFLHFVSFKIIEKLEKV